MPSCQHLQAGRVKLVSIAAWLEGNGAACARTPADGTPTHTTGGCRRIHAPLGGLPELGAAVALRCHSRADIAPVPDRSEIPRAFSRPGFAVEKLPPMGPICSMRILFSGLRPEAWGKGAPCREASAIDAAEAAKNSKGIFHEVSRKLPP